MYKSLYDCFSHWFNDNRGTVWLYSDPHFGDDEMKHLRKNYIGDDEQVKRINSKVGKNDTLVILGDVGDIDYVRKLRGRKILIMGNHDSGASNYRRSAHMVRVYDGLCGKELDEAIAADERSHVIDWVEYDIQQSPFTSGWKDNRLFDEVYEGPLFISDKILLSHEPIDLPYALNIHGHDHSGWSAHGTEGDPCHINVCAEWINYTPVKLKDIIESGALKHISSIHRDTIDRATERSKKRR